MLRILMHMKDNPCWHLLLKFGPKTWKSPMTLIYPKLLCCQFQQAGPLGDKVPWENNNIMLMLLFDYVILP